MARSGSQSTSNFVIWHRKQGPFFRTPPEDFANPFIDVSRIIVGEFLDDQDSLVGQIQSWVDSWSTRNHILVSKEDNLFFFYCREFEDKAYILGRHVTLNFQGALLILKEWRPSDSSKSLNFFETALWVKLEGLPLVLNSTLIAKSIIFCFGKFLHFDDNYQQSRVKKNYRAFVWIKLKRSLVPGVFIEV